MWQYIGCKQIGYKLKIHDCPRGGEGVVKKCLTFVHVVYGRPQKYITIYVIAVKHLRSQGVWLHHDF